MFDVHFVIYFIQSECRRKITLKRQKHFAISIHKTVINCFLGNKIYSDIYIIQLSWIL